MKSLILPTAPIETSPDRPWLEIVRVASPAEEAAAYAIRRRVFSEEQGVADLRVSDADDPISVIALARIRVDGNNGHGQRPVSTGRLTPSPFSGGQAQIAWVATLPEVRGLGIGGHLMRYLLDVADEAGTREILLAAQAHAEAFYWRLGFRPAGPLYDVRGIPHLRMIRRRPH